MTYTDPDLNLRRPGSASSLQLAPEWKCWIAENVLLGVPEQTIVSILAGQGIPTALAQQEIRSAMAHPYLITGQNFLQLLKKIESQLAIYDQLAQLVPETIERREGLSRSEFLEQYYVKNQPVILTGIMQNWTAPTRWTPEYLKANYGQVEVEVQMNRNADRLYERKLDQHRQKMLLQDYVDLVFANQSGNDCYMVANNHNLDRPELQGLLEDIEFFPEFLDPTDRQGRMFFWFGPAGTVTPLHHDPMNLLLAQVQGRKLVKMISPHQTPWIYNYQGVFSEVDIDNPDYDRYPLFQKVRPIEFVLEPGEVLFIPVGWWHYVRSLEVSISLSFTNLVFPNQYEWNYPSIQR